MFIIPVVVFVVVVYKSFRIPKACLYLFKKMLNDDAVTFVTFSSLLFASVSFRSGDRSGVCMYVAFAFVAWLLISGLLRSESVSERIGKELSILERNVRESDSPIARSLVSTFRSSKRSPEQLIFLDDRKLGEDRMTKQEFDKMLDVGEE